MTRAEAIAAIRGAFMSDWGYLEESMRECDEALMALGVEPDELGGGV